MVDLLLASLIINLDFIPIVYFVFWYSFLEFIIKKLMADFRSIQIQQHHHDLQQQQQPDEEDLIRERIIFPVNLDLIHQLEQNYDDVSEDYDEDDDYDDDDVNTVLIEDYDDDDDEELIPVPIEDFDDEYDFEDDDFDDDFDDDYPDDFDDEEENYMTSPSRVSNSVTVNVCGNGTEETSSSSISNGNGDHIDGLICPICFEPWTSCGTHQICCLPCGHLYGLSCIKKWLYQRRSSGKCPQCNSLCTFKDVRVLYVNRLCVADEELQKRVRLLEAKCAYLEQKVVPLTPDELIGQICNNPTLLQRLATTLTELQQPQVSP
uniref:E3 ubiquitin-protein ligase CIP8 n=1 Tax=Erigeron canadensis TaxID=72917 RepID=UPI001CB9AB19|nr:E3 ubiquitin-protein ligase CIP8 [Erigeron canadensis]